MIYEYNAWELYVSIAFYVVLIVILIAAAIAWIVSICKGAKTYDFEGISGSMDPKDEYYGQTDFKKSFGGDYLEFLGEFDAVFRPSQYAAWKRTNWFISHARRRLRYLFYRKK